MALKICLKGLRQFVFQINYWDTDIKPWEQCLRTCKFLRNQAKFLALGKKMNGLQSTNKY